MQRLNCQNQNVYETTIRNRNFLLFVDMEQNTTHIYTETDDANIYYLEDRIGTFGNPDECAKTAEKYIDGAIDTIEYCRARWMEWSKTGEPVWGYPRRINKSELAA